MAVALDVCSSREAFMLVSDLCIEADVAEAWTALWLLIAEVALISDIARAFLEAISEAK